MEQWLFTFDSATGEVSRVEKLDPVSSMRQELSEDEYAALNSYAAPSQATEGPKESSDEVLITQQAAAIRTAYWQGVADCATFYRRYLLR
jgi:hypothetical protein